MEPIVPPLALAPLPVSVETGDTGAPFVISAATPVTGDPAASAELHRLLAARCPRDDKAATGTIVLSVSGEGVPESYTLEVAPEAVRIVGADPAGLFYGVQTLAQLVRTDADRAVVPAVRIDDAPRFAYRGVMLDVARHFHDVATIIAYIDRAASLKFNALHLHLSDDQGWRIQVHARPRLTDLASSTAVGGDRGGFYTHDDYARIVAHAAAKHMIVVPEIDVPGHTHAVSLAYPELAEQPVISDGIRAEATERGEALPVHEEPYEGISVGFSSLQIRNDDTYAFLDDVLREIAGLTPGPYLHVGGDEALGTAPADYALFMARVTAMVTALGKTPIAWHEAGAAADLHADTVGQYWGFVEPVGESAERTRTFATGGPKVILSPADAVYLDMKSDAASPLGLTWARGVTSARRAYEWEPADVVAGIGESDILGVEAPLWSETASDLDDIDALAFPRIAAAAEAAWSPRTGEHPDRTWASFRTRVAGLAPLWRALGIRFTPLPEIDWTVREDLPS